MGLEGEKRILDEEAPSVNHRRMARHLPYQGTLANIWARRKDVAEER